MIVSSVYPDGVHAIRGDLNIEYYIALESGNSFPAACSISPDGRYFAYPIGQTWFYANRVGNNILYVDNLRVVRTDGNVDETYPLNTHNSEMVGLTGSLGLPSAVWFGTAWIYCSAKFEEKPTLIDFQSGELRLLQPDILTIFRVSPDGTRATIGLSDETNSLYDLESNSPLTATVINGVWFPDSTSFIAVNETNIFLVDRDGKVKETIGFEGGIGVTPLNWT